MVGIMLLVLVLIFAFLYFLSRQKSITYKKGAGELEYLLQQSFETEKGMESCLLVCAAG